MHEAEEMSDRIRIVNHGRIVAEGTPSEITGMVPGKSIMTIDASNAQSLDTKGIEGLDTVESVFSELSPTGSSTIRIHAAAGSEVPIGDVVQSLIAQGVEIENLGVSKPTLEDAFISLTAD
jgi:ABC-2 type transport system ATP-binding protein